MKHELLRALDRIIASLREATVAIQRDDLEAALELMHAAGDEIQEARRGLIGDAAS